MPSQQIKDPSAVLDFAFDWTSDGWLADGETITSHTIDADDGITVDSSTEDSGTVTVWLSGGTAGETYKVVCHVVTDQGREDDRTMTVRMQQR